MTSFRLFQTERVCIQQFQIWWKWQTVLEMGKKHCGEKEKLLITSTFPFSHRVFERFVLQTRRNQGLFGKGLSYFFTVIPNLFGGPEEVSICSTSSPLFFPSSLLPLPWNICQEEGYDGPRSLTWVIFPTKWILPSLLLLFQHVTLGWGQFWSEGYHMNKIDKGPQGDATYKALSLPVSEKNFEVGLLSSYVPTCDPQGGVSFDPRRIIWIKLIKGLQGDAK